MNFPAMFAQSDQVSSMQPDTSRYKIWQLHGRLHCTIIGTCLSMRELRKLCKKADLDHSGLSDYNLHHAFVGMMGEANLVAKLTHKFLDKKYQRYIQHLCDARQQSTLKTLWQQYVAKGEIAGPFWAMVSHPSTSPELLELAYGEVHMMSHLEGSSSRADLKKLSNYKDQVRELKEQEQKLIQKINQLSKEKNELRLTINDLASKLADTERSNLLLTQQLTGSQDAPDLTQSLSQRVANLSRQKDHANEMLDYWKSTALKEKSRTEYLSEQVLEKENERQALERTLYQSLMENCPNPCKESEHCPLTNLNGQQILYVGGRANQCSHFKQLVNRLNGDFLHHDGGQEESQQRLQSNLAKADIIFCPIDCVSHSAMGQVKKHCECSGKKVVWLQKSSLSAFTKGLEEVAA